MTPGLNPSGWPTVTRLSGAGVLLAESFPLNHASSLRTRLRDDTGAAHDRVDAAYGSCDLATRDGLGFFLSNHLRAFSGLALADGAERAQAEVLRLEYCTALEADLRALGLQPFPVVRRLEVTPTPTLYILLGSRRGAQVMRRHWASHARGAARQAGAFLSLDPRNGEWRQLCLDLGARPAHGPGADRIIDEVNAIFGLFDPQLAHQPEGTP